LILHPVEGKLSSALVQDIRRSGTRVFGLDQRLEASACDVLAYVDPKRAGQLAGDVAVEALRRKAADSGTPGAPVVGRVVHISMDEESSRGRLHFEGMMEALKVEPGIVLVHDAPALWTREGGAARIQDALRLQGQFDVVVGQTDAIAHGASEALVEAGRREDVLMVAIGGLRGPDGGVELLRRVIVDAVVRHPLPMETIYPHLAALAKDSGYKPTSEPTEMIPTLLTPANLEDALRANR
jgi:ABC-type sugar transport system substrate-binding protein